MNLTNKTIKFTDESGNAIVFELETTTGKTGDAEELPVKLGDGNFGCVFAAKGTNQELALKVIYEHESRIDNASPEMIDYKELRVKEELNVKQTIYNALTNSKEVNVRNLTKIYEKHLVLPLACTTQLDKEEKFQVYAKIYEKYDLIFSKYAYLMNRYECSLKDLLEYGGAIPPPGDKDYERYKKMEPYAQLKAATLSDRERSALPVVLHVANGLHILHAVGLRHQDIKPANIYFRRDLNDVEFVLGDLGFLHTKNPVLAGSAMVSTDALAIGTKHYRSVEQIDHTDISEVSIESQPNGVGVVVISRDPKFLRTNIRKGDLIMFPRSKSRILFEIEQFEFNEEESAEIRITISAQNSEEPEKGDPLKLRDGVTQAAFIKYPSERTDLFGLGAILFDIISSGESAERFYELLRKFDTKGTKTQQTILNFYPTWKTGQTVDPDISAIFQRVNIDKKGDVSSGVLAFLLNCLMSEPDDSYFMRFFSEERSQYEKDRDDCQKDPWSAVTSNIEALIRDLSAQEYFKSAQNILTSKQPQLPATRQILHPETVSSLLTRLQCSEERSRWLRVASFLLAMTDLVRRTIRKISSPKEDTAFISMAPEHLVVDYNDEIIKYNTVVGTCSQKEYAGRLAVLDPIFSSLESDSNPYLPTWWKSRQSKVEIRLHQSEGMNSTNEGARNEAENLTEIAIKFSDCTSPNKDVQTGDYVVVANDDSLYSLYEIRGVEDGFVQIGKCRDFDDRDNSDVDFEVDEYRSGYIINLFDVHKYCGSMLAVYLFHSLLVGEGRNGISDFGREVISKSAYFPITGLTKPSSLLRYNRVGIFGKQKRKPTNEELKWHTVQLYVWLMVGGYTGDTEQFAAISQEISAWAEQVGLAFGVNMEEIEHRVFEGYSEESIQEEKQRMGSDSVGTIFQRSVVDRVAKRYLEPI